MTSLAKHARKMGKKQTGISRFGKREKTFAQFCQAMALRIKLF
jgi:hypothetical protein